MTIDSIDTECIGCVQESSVLPAREAVCRAGVSLHQLTKSPSEHPFHGLLASQLQCRHCGHQVALLVALSIHCHVTKQINVSLYSKHHGTETMHITPLRRTLASSS